MRSGDQLRQAFLDFMCSPEIGHRQIPSYPLVPENDPTTLFTSSGMQPLIPYLLGQPHPLGKRLANSQKCFRSQDIEEVGDNRHTTFFEMLGNWSLGDYFKREQLTWFWKFLTEVIGLDANRLYVTVFSGDSSTGIGKDDEAIQIWQALIPAAKYVELDTEEKGYELGMQGGRIFGYGVKKNWWSRSGIPADMPPGEPGGPDSEVFYDFGTPHDPSFGRHCHPNCDCGRFMEIGNSVFMQYQKQADGSLGELPQKNVDFGGGLERIAAAQSNTPDVFQTSFYADTISAIEAAAAKTYQADTASPMRVIADHLKAAVFLINDGVRPSNKLQGYLLRRLIRRALVKFHQLGASLTPHSLLTIVDKGILSAYDGIYFHRPKDQDSIFKVLADESARFSLTLNKGLKLLDRVSPFDLYQSYGFPIEVTAELYAQQGKKLDIEAFKSQLKAHQTASRSASAGVFKGGLENQSATTIKYHTATHLLHKALRDTLGAHVQQKGSHITTDRLRFDFSHPEKIPPETIQLIEQQINSAISADLPVTRVEMDKSEAIRKGALAFFPEKYPQLVSVYVIGDTNKPYSMELCGGPHVNSTGQIGGIKITKEQSIGSGVRRLYAVISETQS